MIQGFGIEYGSDTKNFKGSSNNWWPGFWGPGQAPD
jgi:hypothetical protein